MTSKDISNHLWMPFTSSRDFLDYPPLVITRGSGIYLFDKEDNRYIDAIGSWWVSIFGHNHPSITSALRRQLDRLDHVHMAGSVSDATLELTELLGEIVPEKLTKLFFSDNGSTSVEVALKIALQYHYLRGEKRTAFVSLGGGYHGDTLGAASTGAIPAYHSIFHHTFKKQHYTDPPYCYRCPAQKEPATCTTECLDSLERILTQQGETIAAFIFEPMVQGAVGMRIYPAKVLRRIFSLCKKHGVLSIADEVAMGLGRTGTMFGCDHAGESPDMMCLAKGLTGGTLPLAVTAVRNEIYEEFCGDHPSQRTFEHGHTFTGNPLASAAACASVKLLKELQIPHSLQPLITHFHNGLEHFRDLECVGDIRALGMVGAVEIVADRLTKEPHPPQERFCFRVSRKALKHGLIIRPLGNCIYFMPPYTITPEELDTMLSLTRISIEEVLNETTSS